MALRSGQRVWVNNAKFRKRPGIIMSFPSKYVEVLVPINGETHGTKFRASSLSLLDNKDFNAWSTKWDDIVAGKYLFV